VAIGLQGGISGFNIGKKAGAGNQAKKVSSIFIEIVGGEEFLSLC
jgi:hypothetical protein